MQAVASKHHMLFNIISSTNIHLPASKQRMGEVNNTSTDFGFGLQLPQLLAVSTMVTLVKQFHKRNHSSNHKSDTWIQQTLHAQCSLFKQFTSYRDISHTSWPYNFLPRNQTIPSTVPNLRPRPLFGLARALAAFSSQRRLTWRWVATRLLEHAIVIAQKKTGIRFDRKPHKLKDVAQLLRIPKSKSK